MTGRRAWRGTSLIEVMVAIALLVWVMLAVAGGQLAMLRTQRTTIWRERALWLADARIEHQRAVQFTDATLAAWAASLLPGGTVTVAGGHGGARFSIVAWRDGNAIASSRCEGGDAPGRPSPCVRIPFDAEPIDAG